MPILSLYCRGYMPSQWAMLSARPGESPNLWTRTADCSWHPSKSWPQWKTLLFYTLGLYAYTLLSLPLFPTLILGYALSNLNGDRRMQIWSLGWQVGNLHSINVTRITAFLSYQPCPFPTVVTQVQFAHQAGFCFPEKSTGELMTDQDTMVVMTLSCPRSCHLETGSLGMGLMADKSCWTNIRVLAS